MQERFPGWTVSYDYGADPRAEVGRLIREHVSTVMGHYGTRIRSWDAVNEAVDPATGALRSNVFAERAGSAEYVIDAVFHAAREADATAELVYNDYMSWEAGGENHRSGVLRLLEGFRSRGVPVDALGIQSHIGIYSIDPATGTGRYQEAECAASSMKWSRWDTGC